MQVQTLKENLPAQAKAVLQMSQEAGWQILQAHLQTHLKHKETEKSARLREGKFHEATLLQGRLDGVVWVLEEAKVLSKVKDENINPSY